MNILSQEAKKKQAVVKYAAKCGMCQVNIGKISFKEMQAFCVKM